MPCRNCLMMVLLILECQNNARQEISSTPPWPLRDWCPRVGRRLRAELPNQSDPTSCCDRECGDRTSCRWPG
ncbi:hypothetical protein B0J14DRAFT_34460 [Halenospora varia]|nr:hypothetical protein B0J14DRAFT_34460 [Halenospora varia]